MRGIDRFLLSVAFLLVLAFGVLVFPGMYEYRHEPGGYVLRVNRITQRISISPPGADWRDWVRHTPAQPPP